MNHVLKQCVAIGLGGLLLSASAGAGYAQTLTVTQTNSISVPGITSELSGITWTGGNQWLAVADSGNKLASLSVAVSGSGNITGVTLGPVQTLGGPARDFEGVAYAGSQSIWISDEGTFSGATLTTAPAIRQFDLSTLTETAGYFGPAIFQQIRNNRGFEAVAQNASGSQVWTATEEALIVDGPAATVSNPTVVRLQRFAVSGGSLTPAQQYAYTVDPVHAAQTGATAPQSGLSDLVILPNGKMLALERSAAWNLNPFYPLGPAELPSFQTRIYEIDFSGATALDASQALTAQTYTPVAKHLLWSGSNFMNLEGLAVGGATDNGYLLLGVTDNQSVSYLATTLVGFEVRSIPEPATLVLITSGLAMMLWRPKTKHGS